MSIPVVISTNGYGLPVRPVSTNAPTSAPSMTVAANGFGIPIILTDLGIPFVVLGAGDVAPSVLSHATISPSSGPIGTVFTLTDGTYGGTTPITTDGILTLGGVDVTADIVAGEYTSDAEGALVWEVTATNVAGSIVSTANATVGPASSWILATGQWDDAGVWEDTAAWKDAA